MDTFTDRQKQIIEASIKLIAEKGIQRLTIKNISKSLGISEPAIYRYFASKIDILLAILSHFKESSRAVLEKTISNKASSFEQIESIFINHFKQFAENPALAAVVFSEEIFQNDKRLSEQIRLIMQFNQSVIVKIIKNGQQNNEIRSDVSEKKLALIIMGALRLLVTKWRLSNFSFDLKQEGVELWDSLKKVIERN